LQQQIRFCKSFDGARIAYATMGSGPAIVKAPHWLTHLEYEAESPVWKPWLEAMSLGNTLVRMDERACGLSDWDVQISFEAWVRDLEAVVDAAGLERFALFGHSQGASISIEYAARHPERVTHLVILGGYVRGALRRGLPQERVDEIEATLKLVELGWGREDATYRQMFAHSFIPNATMEQINSLSELQRKSASPKNAVAIMRAFFNIESAASAPKVKCPTLMIHGRDDRRAPMAEGRLIASLIPDAQFVTVDTANHILLEHEPAFTRFFEELRAFVPRAEVAAPAAPSAAATLRQRLAAILAADMEGYSRHMSHDERATVAALDAGRAVFKTHIEANQGRVVDMAGDSVLAVFDSAAGAMTAALAVQKALAGRETRYRIGVHLGDVIEKPDGTVYGDGVNIAARLQSLAEPGGVTVSEAIRGSVKQRLPAAFEDRGEQSVKNIAEPIRTFSVRPG
jgi:pimeloyl-ACP methyl ester carboxylesterase/class 3 adenylate cyclase